MLKLDPHNANRGTDRGRRAVADSLAECGAGRSILVDRDGTVIAGNKTLEAAQAMGLPVRVVESSGDELVVVQRTDLVLDDADDQRARRLAYLDNRAAQLGLDWDTDQILADLDAGVDFEGLFDEAELDELLQRVAAPGGNDPVEARRTLNERFGVPPFSVLDARQGYWQDRKEAWLALGIQSGIGRLVKSTGSLSGNDPAYYKTKRAVEQRLGRKLSNKEFEAEHYTPFANSRLCAGQNGNMQSVFDPVLCELAYRWFCPPGGAVLDPFAGGSVRGIVAAMLGREYVGVDLSAEQIEANREQAAVVCQAAPEPAGPTEDDVRAITPVQQFGAYWAKRDDALCLAGVRGGKVRTCWALAQGASGLVTAGSRSSPQVNIVAHIARALGIPCRVHTPSGALSPEVQAAREAGAEVVQHNFGRNSVIVARAREDAAARGWREIPFGMECQEAVEQTRRQVANVPAEAKRIVMPVGSGMSLAGVLWGLADSGREMPVLGVVVGADPTKRLDRFAPPGWRQRVELRPSGSDYHSAAPNEWQGITLDPHYEAKCLPHLEPGDLLWIVGLRQTAQAAGTVSAPRWIVGDSREIAALAPGEYDFVFSCPPYADLERYSEDPRDLSTMGYAAFLEAYREIIAAAMGMLKDDHFACFVVGDVRDERGNYRNFVADTIAAFRDAGTHLYNEAVLVTPLGSNPLRVGRQFEIGRKLGKSHQNVLVFCKGDWRRATAACGQIEVSWPQAEEAT